MTAAKPPVSGFEPTLLRDSGASASNPSEAGEVRPEQLPVVDRSRYEVRSELAQGGIGRILQARDVELDRPVALKELLEPSAPARARFVTEALVTARLQHPSIVPVYQAGRWESGEPFFAMKLVSGRPLADVIASARGGQERLALLPHVLAVAEAMAYAHTQGIIHRDLKPANVLVGEFGETVVIDWGLAKRLTSSPGEGPSPPEAGASEDGPASLTQVGAVLGTPAYMPPEQASGQPVDARADVYALGAILYHVLAGSPPYQGDTASQVLRQVLHEASRPLPRGRKGVSEELRAIVTKAMAREPAGRYPSARELAEDLRRFQTGQIVAAHAYSWWARVQRFVKRYRAAVAVAGVALGVLAVLGTVSLRRILAESARAERGQAQAEAARREAVARADALTLMQARGAVEENPNQAVAWLRSLSPAFTDWSAVRTLAAAAKAQGFAQVLRGHTAPLTGLLFTPDGQRVVTSSEDHTVRVWHLATGQSTVLSGHTGPVKHLTLSPDGRTLASTSKDGTVRLWEVETGEARVLRGHRQEVAAVFLPEGRELLSLGEDGTLRRWDVGTGESRVLFQGEVDFPLLALSEQGTHAVFFSPMNRGWLLALEHGPARGLEERHAGIVTGAVFLRDGRFVTAGRDGRVRRWEAHGASSQLLAEGMGGLLTLARSADGRYVAAGGYGPEVWMKDLSTGKVRTFAGHEGPVVRVAFSPDGRFLASASFDRTVRLWELSTNRARVLRGFSEAVESLAFSPDGRRLAAGSKDGTARVFEARMDLHHALDMEAASFGMDLSSDGRWLATATREGGVRLWEPGAGTWRELRGHPSPARSLRFSPDGRRLAARRQGPRIDLWTLDGGLERSLQTRGTQVHHLAFSAEGRFLAASADDGTVHLWELASGQERTWALPESSTFLAFSPDGRHLASTNWKEGVRLWNLETGDWRVLHAGGAWALAFSPDGRHLAFGDFDQGLWLWNLERGEAWHVDAGRRVAGLTFSLDGGTLFGQYEQDARILRWEVKTGAALEPFRGHQGDVVRLALSPEGSRLASTSADGTVRLWDVGTGESRVLHRHVGTAVGVRFLSEGRQVVSSGSDGVIRISPDDLPLQPEALRAWMETADTAPGKRAP
jgi:WD40 repeat protein/predicted Ser/Thr protein kinase